jgi:hypothetical protein
MFIIKWAKLEPNPSIYLQKARKWKKTEISQRPPSESLWHKNWLTKPPTERNIV